jgi:hypothetical protein
MSRKLQFVFNDRFERLLQSLKTRLGKDTATEVIKEALITLDWVTTQHENGLEVFAQPVEARAIVPYRATAIPQFSNRRAGA